MKPHFQKLWAGGRDVPLKANAKPGANLQTAVALPAGVICGHVQMAATCLSQVLNLPEVPDHRSLSGGFRGPVSRVVRVEFLDLVLRQAVIFWEQP